MAASFVPLRLVALAPSFPVSMTIPSPDLTARNLQALAERWAPNTANERASFQSWMLDLLEALGAERPLPPTPEHQFELPVRVVDREGRESVNFIDYWKAGHVAVEAKVIGGSADDLGLRKAFGQVRNYVAHVPGTPPPYLMVVDVARSASSLPRSGGFEGRHELDTKGRRSNQGHVGAALECA